MSNNRIKLEEQRAQQAHIWGYLAPERWQAVEAYMRGSILDVGCANGIYVSHLKARNINAVGIDLLFYDEWAYLPDSIILADAKKLPVADESFNTIISFETLEHVPQPEDALREYHRVCRQNIIISVPNCDTPPILRDSGLTYHHWVDRSHTNFFTLETIQKTVEKCGFRIQLAKYINPITPGAPFFHMIGLSPAIAGWLGRAFRKFSVRKYYMTLLVVGEKVR